MREGLRVVAQQLLGAGIGLEPLLGALGGAAQRKALHELVGEEPHGIVGPAADEADVAELALDRSPYPLVVHGPKRTSGRRRTKASSPSEPKAPPVFASVTLADRDKAAQALCLQALIQPSEA